MTTDAQPELTLTIGRLQVALGTLRAIDPQQLSDDEQKQRTAAMKRLRRMIERLTQLRLQQIAGGMVANAARLDAATAELERDLAGMQSAMRIIGAISAGIDVLTGILKLASPA